MIQLQAKLAADLAVGGKAAVCHALQQAIELEHSTIPLYLYSLYSLDRNSNREIADIIQSVVVEEMLHMTLACNVLNALGGHPVIDNKYFIPAYPGGLPGGVEGQLTVQLAPFSYDQLDTFLMIEEPEDPLEFPLGLKGGDLSLAATEGMTIGQFYTQILEQINALPDAAFAPVPRHQIGAGMMDGSIIVTNKATAAQAINTIIEQGEGTSTSPEDGTPGEWGHYYRFMEIKMGRRLVLIPGSSPAAYAYAGPVIKLDPNGVYPVATNPKLSNYVTQPAAYNACATFNYTYTNLLKSLHATFNGEADTLPTAIGLMMSLKGQAKAMMSGVPNPALQVGPSFEYQPTNPPIS